MPNELSGKSRLSRLFERLEFRWYFLRSIPLRDFLKIRKIMLIRTVKPYTVLSYARLSAIYEITSLLERERIRGSFVECGV